MKYIFKNNTGFTLIELMVTVAIAGILLGIGLPSFSSALSKSRLATTANELLTALNLAKSEAIKRGVQVTVRRKGSTASQWEQGWTVFVDINGNGLLDLSSTEGCTTNSDGSPKEDCILRDYDALSNGYTLITGNSTYQDYAAYLATGMSKFTTGDTFRLCQGSDTANSRAIAVNALGRARVSSPASSCPTV